MEKSENRKEILKQTIFIFSVIALFWIFVFCVDSVSTSLKREPIMSMSKNIPCIKNNSYSITEYWGLGYKIFKYDYASGEINYIISTWFKEAADLV